ncbi:hypothetical protein GO537_23355 [Escherichia coli]|nr:hypothetical protein [Escherichia coli]EFS2245036.1 hypothetical protein [Shigella sonnei]EFB2249459.1 hypothetical protein [Escherichia coli]EFB2254393.1 hypothetical protein [Escherichia coli]EFC6447133.1 hypothetical protein [Escherichia coli]
MGTPRFTPELRDYWKGWDISLRQKQKKLIMLPSETMIWQPEFTDKTFSRKLGAVPFTTCNVVLQGNGLHHPLCRSI